MGIAAILSLLGAILVIVVVIVLAKGTYIIREYELGMVERLGKYTGQPTQKGLHWRRPLLDKVTKLDMRDRSFSLEIPAMTITDGVSVVVFGQVEFCVDPEKAREAHYSIVFPLNRFKSRAAEIIAELLYTMTFDQAQTGMQVIGSAIMNKLTEYAAVHGYKITNVVITKVVPEQSVLDAMRAQAALSRTKEVDDAVAAAENDRLIAAAKARAEADALTSGASASDTTTRINALVAAIQHTAAELGLPVGTATAFVLDAESIASQRAVATRGGETHVFLGGGNADATSAAFIGRRPK